ncbi:hypothetical protein, partial [Streptomyces turgidiscabies]|uniref:hypothetical protein n=1 Tax=Streptomyces turgidiscabies TaxID=85558 RepID=UPI0019D70050
MANAGLGAGDTGTDVVGAAFPRLVREVWVGDEGLRHADDVEFSVGDALLSEGRRVLTTRPDD